MKEERKPASSSSSMVSLSEDTKKLTKAELVTVVGKLLSFETTESTRKAALETIYRHYQGPLGWYLYHLVGRDKSTMEDLYNDTFAAVIISLPTMMNRPGQLPTLEQFQKWLYKIASNKAIDYLRRANKIKFITTPSNEPDDPQEYAVYAQCGYYGQEEQISERMYIQQVFALMSEKYRTCLILQDVLGASQRDIAEKLNCSEKSVSANVCRARRQFSKIYRSLMEQQGTNRKEEKLL